MMAAAPRPSPRRRSSCSRLSRKSRLCSAGPHQPSPHTGPRTNCSIKTNPPPSVRSPAAARRQVDIFLQMPACLSWSNGLLVQAECGEPVPAMLTVRGQSCTNSQVSPVTCTNVAARCYMSACLTGRLLWIRAGPLVAVSWLLVVMVPHLILFVGKSSE